MDDMFKVRPGNNTFRKIRETDVNLWTRER